MAPPSSKSELILHIMKFATSSAIVVVCLSLSVFDAEGAQKKLIKEANVCKRYDPNIQKCFCDNYRKLLPLLKNGAPEMNIAPLEPAHVEHIQMKLPHVKNFRLEADLHDVSLYGLSLGKTPQCNAYITDNGIQLAFLSVFPEIEMRSKYTGNGKFMLLEIKEHGDFHGKFTGMNVTSVWNSTRFMKNNKEHLRFTTKVESLSMDKIQMHFTHIFGNNTELNERINDILNDNMDLLYDDIKPIVQETIRQLTLKIINDVYDTFPFDVLYPTD